MEVMFELPSMSGITHCAVEKETITEDSPVKLSNDSSEIIELATLEKKSASLISLFSLPQPQGPLLQDEALLIGFVPQLKEPQTMDPSGFAF